MFETEIYKADIFTITPYKFPVMKVQVSVYQRWLVLFKRGHRHQL